MTPFEGGAAPTPRIRARGRAHRTPRLLPIRPEPEQAIKIPIPYTGRPIAVAIELYAGRSGADPDNAVILRAEDGTEVVVVVLEGGVPLRVERPDSAAAVATMTL